MKKIPLGYSVSKKPFDKVEIFGALAFVPDSLRNEILDAGPDEIKRHVDYIYRRLREKI